jgi:hypothetical protein
MGIFFTGYLDEKKRCSMIPRKLSPTGVFSPGGKERLILCWLPGRARMGTQGTRGKEGKAGKQGKQGGGKAGLAGNAGQAGQGGTRQIEADFGNFT